MKTEYLADDFNDNSLDSTKWQINTSLTNGSSSHIIESGSTLSVQNNSIKAYYIDSILDTYDLEASTITLSVDLYPEYLSVGLVIDENNQVYIDCTTTQFRLRRVTSGVTATVSSVTVSGNKLKTIKFIRIRETSGRVYGEYSSDGITYTPLGSSYLWPYASLVGTVRIRMDTTSSYTVGRIDSINKDLLDSTVANNHPTDMYSRSPEQVRYLIYDRDNIYIGDIENVTNEFRYYQELNTAGSQITIEVGANDKQIGEYGGNYLADDTTYVSGGGYYVVDDVTAVYFSGLPEIGYTIIAVGNSTIDSEGIVLFNGEVNRILTNPNGVISIRVLSTGFSLDNSLISVPPSSASYEHTLTSGYGTTLVADNYPYPGYSRVGESFTCTGDAEISSVYFKLKGSYEVPATIRIFLGTPISGTDIYSQSFTTSISSSYYTHTVELTTPLSISNGSTYTVTIETDQTWYSGSYVFFYVNYDNAAGYSGTAYRYDSVANSWAEHTGVDYIFGVSVVSVSPNNVFNSYDPSDIVREVLDDHTSIGGSITYDVNSIADTGTTVSYTFKYNTHLEAIKKCVELAPNDWWWYVSVDDNKLYFDTINAEADHILTYGLNVVNLKLDHNTDDLYNSVSFTGGEVAGENLYLSLENDGSISRYGRRLKNVYDNRVTTVGTATTIAQSILDQYSRPKIRVEAIIEPNNYNTATIRLGQMVVIRNYNNMLDSLILQVAAKDYGIKRTILYLGQSPPSVSKRIEDINRNLKLTQTALNPAD